MDAVGFERRSGAALLDGRREVLEEMTDVVAIDEEGTPLEEGVGGVHEGGHGVVVEEEGVSPYNLQLHHFKTLTLEFQQLETLTLVNLVAMEKKWGISCFRSQGKSSLCGFGFVFFLGFLYL